MIVEADCAMLTAVALVVIVNVEAVVRVSGTSNVLLNPVVLSVKTSIELPTTAPEPETIVRVVEPVPGIRAGVENVAVTPLG